LALDPSTTHLIVSTSEAAEEQANCRREASSHSQSTTQWMPLHKESKIKAVSSNLLFLENKNLKAKMSGKGVRQNCVQVS